MYQIGYTPVNPACPRQFRRKPGERDSHKAVPIAVTPHRLIAAEVPLELSLAKPNATITLSVATLSVVPDPLEADAEHGVTPPSGPLRGGFAGGYAEAEKITAAAEKSASAAEKVAGEEKRREQGRGLLGAVRVGRDG